MPIVLSCGRCGGDVSAEARFCQGCGSPLASRAVVPAKLDPNWQPSYDNSQEPIRGLEARDLDSKPFLEQLPVLEIADSSTVWLESVQPPLESAAKHGIFRSVWAIPFLLEGSVALIVVALCTLLVLWTLMPKPVRSGAVNLAFGQAQEAFREGDSQRSFDLLSVLRQSTVLNKEEQLLFDQSALAAATVCLDKGEFEKAARLLEEIGPKSQFYIEARGLLLRARTRKPDTKLDAKSDTKSSDTGADLKNDERRVLGDQSAVPKLKAPDVEISNAPVLSFPRIDPKSVTDTKNGGKSKESEPGLGENLQDETALESPSNARASKNYGRDASDENLAESLPKFSEKDVARYNVYLARHFTGKRKASVDLALAENIEGTDSAAEVKQVDPPSFKEWIRKGMPEF